LIGGELEIPGDSEHFVDSVHFSTQGAKKMAERVSDSLLNSDKFIQMIEK
jgi:lysophospholipase L1-like esterase